MHSLPIVAHREGLEAQAVGWLAPLSDDEGIGFAEHVVTNLSGNPGRLSVRQRTELNGEVWLVPAPE